MRTSGLTSKLPNGLSLFFWEIDHVNLIEVLEEAHFISGVFDIDIYVLESSTNCYHLKSYDVLSHEIALSVQNWLTLLGDYFTLDESGLYNRPENANTLRNIRKGKKQAPKFIKAFYADKNGHTLALKHYQIDKALCGLPDLPAHRLKHAIPLPVKIAVYNTGIGAKPKKNTNDTFFF
jgi:hypothetical protein